MLVRIGNEKSSLNAGVFHPREYHFLNFETTNVDITICKAASSEVQVRYSSDGSEFGALTQRQECCLQILSFSDFLLVRDLKVPPKFRCTFRCSHLAVFIVVLLCVPLGQEQLEDHSVPLSIYKSLQLLRNFRQFFGAACCFAGAARASVSTASGSEGSSSGFPESAANDVSGACRAQTYGTWPE